MKTIYKKEQIHNFVKKNIMQRLMQCKVFTLEGPLGAGKTMLVKEVLRQAGVVEEVTSPTFAYVKSYQVGEKSFHHFDLYRIGSLEGFITAGFDEYLNSEKSVCFIEWPLVIMPLLKHNKENNDLCVIRINYDKENLNVRKIEIE
jgi:tRNA threonylcarbamoyladenosine biosynthesis protein TsaE